MRRVGAARTVGLSLACFAIGAVAYAVWLLVRPAGAAREERGSQGMNYERLPGLSP